MDVIGSDVTIKWDVSGNRGDDTHAVLQVMVTVEATETIYRQTFMKMSDGQWLTCPHGSLRLGPLQRDKSEEFALGVVAWKMDNGGIDIPPSVAGDIIIVLNAIN